MTAWLSEWLRGIVLIILLATFVDLLIPNNSLGRYVKVVISLIILLTILSPVISFLKEDKAVNQALEQASGEEEDAHSLNLILMDGAKMRSDNDRSSTILAEQQVGSTMKAQLESSLPLEVQEVLVTIGEEQGSGPSLQHIQVILRSEGNPMLDKKIIPEHQEVSVDLVSPISVEIRLDDTAEENSTVNQEQVEQNASQLKLEEQVIDQLMKQWALAENRIQVEWR
jgi:stage III sporulation protein AF